MWRQTAVIGVDSVLRRHGSSAPLLSGTGPSVLPASCSGKRSHQPDSMSSSCRAEKCSMRPSPALRSTTPQPLPDATVSDRHPVDRAAITLVLGLVAAYKSVLSPLFAGCCRFEPSCSDYMSQAVSTHGATRGTWLGLRRISRCHPFGRFGADPCPPANRTARHRRA